MLTPSEETRLANLMFKQSREPLDHRETRGLIQMSAKKAQFLDSQKQQYNATPSNPIRYQQQEHPAS